MEKCSLVFDRDVLAKGSRRVEMDLIGIRPRILMAVICIIWAIILPITLLWIKYWIIRVKYILLLKFQLLNFYCVPADMGRIEKIFMKRNGMFNWVGFNLKNETEYIKNETEKMKMNI